MSARPVRSTSCERVLDLLVEAGDAASSDVEQIEPELAAQLRQRRDGHVLAHRQAVEQLVDLIALGQAELADLGDVDAGDVAALEQRSGPTVGGTSQVSILKKVVLPAPFGPMMPRSSP